MTNKRQRELLQAFQLDDVATVAAILAGGEDADAIVDAAGNTLLALAIRGGRRDMASALIAAGASIQRMNAAGETPESLGLASSSLAVRRIFLPRETPPPPPRPALRREPPPPPRIGDAELALRQRWSLELLAIHADELQQTGDPRGELMALDLAPRPTSGPWRERRRALLDAWLGADLSQRAGDITQYGFIPHLDDRAGAHQARRNASLRASELLDSPAGAFVRAFAVSGAPLRVTAALHRLVHRPRPWLTELVILTSPDAPLPADLCERITIAAPQLHTLYAIGGPILAAAPRDVARVVTSVPLDDPRVIQIASLTPPGLRHAELLVLLEAIAESADRDVLAHDYGSLFPELAEHLAFLESIRALDDAGLTALGRALRVHRVELDDRGRIVER